MSRPDPIHKAFHNFFFGKRIIIRVTSTVPAAGRAGGGHPSHDTALPGSDHDPSLQATRSHTSDRHDPNHSAAGC